MNTKKKMLIPFAVCAMLLVSCGDNTPAVTYPVVTFRQARAEDTRIIITPNMTEDEFYDQIPEFVYGDIVEPEGWYEGRWDNLPEFEDIKTSIIVNAVFDPLTFDARFKNEAGTANVEVVAFTYEDYLLDPHKLEDEPTVPAKDGNWYKGEWEEYTLDCRNIDIRPTYSKNTFTLTFTDEDGSQVGLPVDFTIDDYNARDDHRLDPSIEPTVPAKAGYDGTWNYVLTDDNVVASPIYELHAYTINFYEDQSKENLVGSALYNIETASFDDVKDIPEVPEHAGYKGSWDKPAQLTYSDTPMEVFAKYEGNEYKVTFPSGEIQTVTYGDAYTLKEKPTNVEDYEPYFGWKTPEGGFIPQSGTWDYAGDVSLTPTFVHISFEDKALPSFLTVNTAVGRTVEFDDTKAIDGNVSLKITAKSYMADIIADQKFYAAAFSDPEVTEITFYATASKDSNDFSYRYWSQPDHGGRKGQTFQLNKTGWGINKDNWKKFSITRADYDLHNEYEFASFINMGSLVDGDILWVDDIKVNKSNPALTIGFEDTGKIIQPSDTAFPVRVNSKNTETLSYSELYTNSDTFGIKSAEICNDPAFVTEGHCSLHLVKDAYVKPDGSKNYYTAFYTSMNLYNQLDDNDLFEFDLFCSEGFYSGDVKDGQNGKIDSINGNRWIHYSFSKAQLSNDARFLIVNGTQSVGDMYFDNLHVTKVA